MRLSRIFGILSVVCLIAAALTVALPIATVVYGGYKTAASVGGGTLGIFSSTSGNYSIPSSYTVTNNGFLPLDGVYLNVLATTQSGVQLYKVTIGPEDVPAGGSATFNIASANQAEFTQHFGNSTSAQGGIITFTAQVNLAGLIPISVTGDVTVHPGNSTGAPP